MAQVNRLAADTPHGFGGGALDRSKPLTFRSVQINWFVRIARRAKQFDETG